MSWWKYLVYVLVCSKVMFMRNLNIIYLRLITLTQVHAILSFLASFFQVPDLLIILTEIYVCVSNMPQFETLSCICTLMHTGRCHIHHSQFDNELKMSDIFRVCHQHHINITVMCFDITWYQTELFAQT
jgi:hypothetical protein